MRLAILSSGTGWHVRDLERAAVSLNHEVKLIDFRRVRAGVAAGPDPLQDFDGIIVRTMPPGTLEQVVFRMDVLHRLEAAGVRVMNPAKALEACVDKYLTTARLAADGLAVPPTIVCQNADDAIAAFDRLGGDVVVKPLFGSEGRGMLRVTDPDLAWRTFRVLERTQAVLYLQKFVENLGWDLRAFVIDARIVAAMRRHARNGWRTNVAQGGRAEAVRLSSDESRLALRAAHAVGASIAGIDLLPGKDGQLYVLEVNAVPGWRSLSAATGHDIALEVVKHVTAGNSQETA
jgi:ribosomal protein S6--L-glutamate ligase